ncbi:hypothetical protein [Tsukamurella soli]|uniref:Uncharacterized protein n=1 Tax=Tsukamurella soli TaxID=644556 RepID=A0ABP8KBH5_9ACTN
MTFDRPGTIDDLLTDGRTAGHHPTARLVRDWTERGLLDSPTLQPAGKGHGSRPALYTANQRLLFVTLLDKRTQTTRIPALARVVVCIWLYWGDDYVPTRQARKAFLTWLGDPGDRGPRVNKKYARDCARAVLGQLDHPGAGKAARAHLLDLLAETSYTGRFDPHRVEEAIRAVFEPDHAPRYLGAPGAPLTVESVLRLITARSVAVDWLIDNRDDILAGHHDQRFIDARQQHLLSFAEYIALQPEFARTATPSSDGMYLQPNTQLMVDRCCTDVLTILGLHLDQRPEETHR